METKTTNDSFGLLSEAFVKNYEAVTEAIADQKVADANLAAVMAPDKTPTSNLFRKKPARKKPKVDRSMEATVGNARKFNAEVGKFAIAWNSNNAPLKLLALQTMRTEAATLVRAVSTEADSHTKVLNSRSMLYGTLEAFATCVSNALKSCGASQDTLKELSHIMKLLRGQRIIAMDPNNMDANYISACHTTFVNRLASFGSLITLADGEALYDPIPDELKIPALRARYDAMDDANGKADDSQATLNAARRVRNAFFNTEGTGLVDTYQSAKSLAKSVYGVKSAEFKAIKGLAFRRIEE